MFCENCGKKIEKEATFCEFCGLSAISIAGGTKKNRMRNNMKYAWFILILLVVGFLFYWFELRPVNIKKNCVRQAGDVRYKFYGEEYQKCLHENGL